MPWATLWSPALSHLRAATSNINLCLGQSCGLDVGELLCDMSCIVNDNHSKKNHLHHIAI